MGIEPPPAGQLIIYHDGATKLQVRLDGQTVWLTQAQMVELYQTTKQNISLHIRNIFEERELEEAAVVKYYLTTASDGKNYRTAHYSLEVILAVGYRVRSARGTLFRQWATVQLQELLVKGFVLDDERIKAGRTIGGEYFDEQDSPSRNQARRVAVIPVLQRLGQERKGCQCCLEFRVEYLALGTAR